MRLGRFLPLLIVAAALPVYLYALSSVSLGNKRLQKFDELSAVLPSSVLKITSLDFDGLASDIMYLRTIVFYGSTLTGTGRRKVTDSEFNWMNSMLTTTTDLDPYFLDPYYFANATLTWDGHKVRETNVLLEKGVRYRDWDYWLPFYLGFNHFYFLGDNEKAAGYLMDASRKPGASPFFGHLGARLAYRSNKVENAITFMEGILETIQDKTMHHDYELRLEALKSILYLDKGLAAYKAKTGRTPSRLAELREQGVIDRIPQDPYGGEFYIDKDGAVKTTSNLMMME